MTTASGGNIVKGAIIRNEQCPQCGLAMIEDAGMDMSAYEIIMICLTAITLLLKLLKTFKSNKHK